MTSSVTSSTPDSSGRAGRVVVTGGSGFVGRAVVRALLDRGTPVVVADQEPLPASIRDDRVRHVQGELTDPDVRDRALAEGCTGVIHLAAVTSVLKSAEQPAATFETNVRVTHELLELARQRGIGQFVLASTNAVVGDIGHGTISEGLPLQPLTPYGSTKAAAEMLLSGYAGAYGLATASLRFTNIYGPGMGHKDSFIPRLMRAALAGEGVQVFGDGSQSRDFVHVQDVVQGIMAAYDKQYTGTAIIGSGESISVTQLIESVRAATGEPLPVEHVPAKQGEMPAVIVDVSTAKRELGYTPTMGLTDGLRTVWDDFRATAADGTP